MSTLVSTMPPGILARSPAPVSTSGASAGVDAWSVVAWMGAALALVGWSDVIIGLYPYQVGNPDWEFGAVSAALNSMPLGALGIGVSVAAAIAQRRRLALITLGVVCTLITAFMVVSGGMYLLSVPVILKAVPTAMRGQIFLVIIKASLLLFTYTSLYVILCRFAWKAARVNQKNRS